MYWVPSTSTKPSEPIPRFEGPSSPPPVRAMVRRTSCRSGRSSRSTRRTRTGYRRRARTCSPSRYSLNFGLRILRARLFGTSGPGKTGDVINDFAQQIAAIERTGQSGKLKVGNLEPLRDVSDVRDVLKAMWRIFEAGDPLTPINVGAGRSYSIRTIAEQLQKLARVPIEITPEPSLLRPTDERDNRADISRLRALGYSPSFTLAQTLQDSLDFWRESLAASPGKVE